MYKFHYGFIQEMYGDNARLLFTDTDSLAYEIQTEDFYEDITPNVQEKFATSNYPANHRLRNSIWRQKDDNLNVQGRMWWKKYDWLCGTPTKIICIQNG